MNRRGFFRAIAGAIAGVAATAVGAADQSMRSPGYRLLLHRPIYRLRLRTEAIGKDWHGAFVPIDRLSYRRPTITAKRTPRASSGGGR